MERTTKVRITKTRKRTVNLSLSAQSGFCGNCQREVQMLTSQQAAQLLAIGEQDFASLAAAGELHVIPTANNTFGVCQDSLICR